jgi:hypothetical protein
LLYAYSSKIVAKPHAAKIQIRFFLSHSVHDVLAVRELGQRLRADGLRVWFEKEDPNLGESRSKVDGALRTSRTLVLLMLADAFAEEWVKLERQTALFRDPASDPRRFIPVRLDEAEIKDSLKQFAYIDWRNKSTQQYEILFAACRQPAIEPRVKSLPNIRLKGHDHNVVCVAMSRDGKRAVSGSEDKTVACGTWRQAIALSCS